MNEIPKYILKTVLRLPLVSRILAGIIIGVSTGLVTYYALDNLYYKPKTEVLERHRHAKDVFAEIADLFWGPNYNEYFDGSKRTLYNSTPGETLEILMKTKKIIEDNREPLTTGGYITNITQRTEGFFDITPYQGIQESQLDSAIKNVQTFTSRWPGNDAEWYAYLYAGDTQQPPRRYAKEIESFYESARKAEATLEWNLTRSNSIKNLIPIPVGIMGGSLILVFYPSINRFLINRYKKNISRYKLEQSLEKLKSV